MAMPSPATQTDRELLAGIVGLVTFHRADTRFCVLRVKARGHRDLATIVGHAAAISAGEWITAAGDWVNDRIHGRQFKVCFISGAPSGTRTIGRKAWQLPTQSRPSSDRDRMPALAGTRRLTHPRFPNPSFPVSHQFVEQRLRLFQVCSVEAFGEPAINRSEEIAGFAMLALFGQQVGQCRRTAKFQSPRSLLVRNAHPIGQVFSDDCERRTLP